MQRKRRGFIKDLGEFNRPFNESISKTPQIKRWVREKAFRYLEGNSHHLLGEIKGIKR